MKTDEEMKDLYEEARQVDIVGVLSSYGYRPDRNENYLCPFHSEKTPSAKINNNRLKCFGRCTGIEVKNSNKVSETTGYSSIDVVMKLENCSSFQAVKKLLNLNYDKTNKNKEVIRLPLQLNRTNNIKQDHQKKKKHFTYEDGINMSNPLGPNNIGYIKDCLKNRGILKLLEIDKDIGIELRHCYFNSKNHICYAFIKENLMIQKPINERGKARNFGHSKPIKFERNDSNIWYVVEGIEDALTLIIYHNYNVLCLNSLSNLNQFLNNLNENFNTKEVEFIIATDYDEAGMNAMEDLIRFFSKNDIQYDLYYSFYNYIADHQKGRLKDVNDCLCHSKKLNIAHKGGNKNAR